MAGPVSKQYKGPGSGTPYVPSWMEPLAGAEQMTTATKQAPRGVKAAYRAGQKDVNADLLAALRDLVARCDGAEGVRADGSNIQTMQAHAAIARATEE